MTGDEFDSHREPDEVFTPLDDERYCRFYDLEMEGFREDLPFYLQHVQLSGSVLELGCGTGRLCRLLAAAGAQVTGIDRSLPMLRAARDKSGARITYLCMDMIAPALRRPFDTIVIPYHTLNLLRTEERIRQCLGELGPLLRRNGNLLMQLHVPDQALLAAGPRRHFWFQLFDLPDGGRLIKEIRRAYRPEDRQLVLEERYRVRPRQPGPPHQDLSHTLRLAALSPADRKSVV